MNHTKDLHWAAGLWIGEGCFTHTGGRGAGGYRYLIASLGMYDKRAMTKLASIVGRVLATKLGHPDLVIYKQIIKRRPGVKEHFRVSLCGHRAEAWAEAILPLIKDTDKEDKLLGELPKCGLELWGGKMYRENRPRVRYGVSNGNCKVTDRQVNEIRKKMKMRHKRGDGIARKLAERFGVSESLIHSIAAFRSRAGAS